MNGQRPEDGSGGENTLWNTVMVHACHCTFVQPVEHTTPRRSCNVNYRLRVIVMCRCRFITYSEMYHPGGEAMNVWGGAETYGNSLYLSLNFPVNLKVL